MRIKSRNASEQVSCDIQRFHVNKIRSRIALYTKRVRRKSRRDVSCKECVPCCYTLKLPFTDKKSLIGKRYFVKSMLFTDYCLVLEPFIKIKKDLSWISE